MKTLTLITALAAAWPLSASAQEAANPLPYQPGPVRVAFAEPTAGSDGSSGARVEMVQSHVPKHPLANPVKTFVALNRNGEDIFKGRDVLPYAAFGVVVLATDKQTIKWFDPDPADQPHGRFAKAFSTYGGIGGIGGTTLILMAAGGRHGRESGKMVMAAVANATVLTYGLKYLSGKERPIPSNDTPRYHPASGFQNDSFPSGHTSASTAAAVVLGHQYPKYKMVFYALAGGVAVARIKGRNHFPGDVYWGAGVGYYSGRQALRNSASIARWSF